MGDPVLGSVIGRSKKTEEKSEDLEWCRGWDFPYSSNESSFLCDVLWVRCCCRASIPLCRQEYLLLEQVVLGTAADLCPEKNAFTFYLGLQLSARYPKLAQGQKRGSCICTPLFCPFCLLQVLTCKSIGSIPRCRYTMEAYVISHRRSSFDINSRCRSLIRILGRPFICAHLFAPLVFCTCVRAVHVGGVPPLMMAYHGRPYRRPPTCNFLASIARAIR